MVDLKLDFIMINIKTQVQKLIDKAEDIFNDAEIIVKVKEPLANEVKND